jgi:sulfide:quinone oxidoreductase
MAATQHHEVLIVGGGSAGITVAARLHRARPKLDIAVIEPSTKHYYQPLWTLVGGGIVAKQETERDEQSVIPEGVAWIRDSAVEFDPDANRVRLAGGGVLRYDWLVVAPGIQINWDAIRGLPDALGRDGVCSNYSYAYVDTTWQFLREFRGGNAVFTYPDTPIKCGGAPQKIMWLAQHYLEQQGLVDGSRVIFASAGQRIFGVDKYRRRLEELVERRHIDTRWQHNLVEVRAAQREAVFEVLGTGSQEVIPYEFLHVVPPMSAPDVVRQSPLADPAGWVDVDKHSLQHVRYANVFSLGDASSLPTSKTGAAIRKQAPVLVHNLLAAMAGKPLYAAYDGYTSCPIVTGYGRLILAEFDYDGTPTETFPFDQSKERRSMYLLKRHVLPPLYWHGMLAGRA